MSRATGAKPNLGVLINARLAVLTGEPHAC